MFDKTVVGHWFCAFARLKLRGPTRFHRGVGRGSWAMKSTHKAGDGQGSIMKRFFIYEERPDVASPAEGGDDDGHWSMQEFSLAGAKDNDYVICRVKKRPKH
ncbi:unnamed protein product [Linum trigynum]|uniref:NAC domain-containing protein n=1 Tax=Linum trigynum TaxID=586398 RepID=A0AAV2CDD9_9ROSI